MKRAASQLPPLLIEWSPGRVRAFDTSTRETRYGATIGECLILPQNGREIIVAISQRSAFIRSIYVPNASREDISQGLVHQLAALLPLTSGEYVTGFRLGADVPKKGRLAVVGAVKTVSLRKIHAEAADASLRIRSVLPLAFGSWLAAKAHSLPDCVVAETHNGALNIEVVLNAELQYSRSVPSPETTEGIDDEILRTMDIAEAGHLPVVSAASPSIDGSVVDNKETIEYLADPHQIDRLIFSLDLPEKVAAQKARTRRAAAQRALSVAAVAVLFAVYVYLDWLPQQSKQARDSAAVQVALQRARGNQKLSEQKLAEANGANRVLDAAFHPAQSFADILAVISTWASANSWFTGVSVGRGQPLVVSGQSLNDRDIAAYVGNLSKDTRFSGVKLVSTTKGTIGKKIVTQFVVSGHPLGLVPLDRVLQGDKKL